VLPLEAAYLTVVDGAGGQMALVARRWPEGDLAVFHVIFDDVYGLREAFGFPSQPAEEFVDMLDDLEDDGLTPVEVPLEEVRNALEEAYQRCLEQQGRAPVVYLAWRAFLAGDDPRELSPVELPRVRLPDDLELLAESDRLLELDEFGSWYFEPQEIRRAIDRLHRILRYEKGKEYERQVVNLIRRTLNDLLDPQTRRLFQQRLERQAALLARIYDDPRIPGRCLAAAAALAEESGVAVTDHPLLQKMLVQSLESAVGQSLVESE
jgi:predicted nucleic acid-binding protein